MDFAKLVFEAKPFDGVLVFDVHGHVGSAGGAPQNDYDADALIHTMDRVGVDVLCISSLTALFSDCKWGNRETVQACAKYPGRLLGYAVPTPFYDDCDLAPFFEKDMGFCGIKIHGSAQGGTPENDPRYHHAFELANKLSLPILFHAWESAEILRAAEVARQYPNTKVILGHAGMTSPLTAVEVCKKHDNIFCDTAISATRDGAIEWLVDKIGEDRVLYGSDMAFFECVHTLGKLALAKISDEAKEKILGRNAAALFKR